MAFGIGKIRLKRFSLPKFGVRGSLFAAFAVIARALTREDMGILAVLTLVASGAQVLSGLGLGSTATQFVASLQGQGDPDNTSRAGYSCLIINASMTAIVATVTFFSAGPLAVYLLGTASRAIFFKLLTWEVAALGVNYSLGSLLLGLKRFRNYSKRRNHFKNRQKPRIFNC